MVTVLFIGMVMTVVVSSAAFITVRQVRSGTDDSRGGKALAFAEAGVDRMHQFLRSNSTGWRNITLSGCPYSGSTPTTATQTQFTGQLGTGVEVGTYTVTLAPNTTTNSYCAAATSPLDTDTPPPIDSAYQMAITSTGTFGNTTKTVKQTVQLDAVSFPIGLSTGTLDSNGNATVQNEVIIARGAVSGRNKINMTGTDFFYKKSNFYPTIASAQASQAMPASVHTYDKSYVSGGRAEHPPSCNTSADKTGTESTWDGSSTGGTISSCGVSPFPPTSKFTLADYQRLVGSNRLDADDHLFYKSQAQDKGIYCNIPTSGTTTCTRLGVTDNNIGTNVSTADVTNTPNACPTTPCYIVAYFEFQGGNAFTNRVDWNAAIPNTCTRGMVVLIIKNGGIAWGGGAQFSGAIFAEDGRVTSTGGPYIEGTVSASDIQMRGNPTYAMTNCWLQNLPGPFIQVTALRWSELDR
jgi:hypothetical protein